MATVKVTDSDFDEKIAKGFTLVDFWAEWCGPCKMVEPILEEISESMKEKLTIAKLNVDENPNTPQKFGVQGIPTMILFKDGKLVDRVVGALPKANLMDFIEANLGE